MYNKATGGESLTDKYYTWKGSITMNDFMEKGFDDVITGEDVEIVEEDSGMDLDLESAERLKFLFDRIAGMTDSDDEEKYPTADAIHNESADYARRRAYGKAAKICIDGLERFPDNIDLLADVVKYTGDSGDADTAKEYLNMLLARPRRVFNWRAFTFSIDFLIATDPVGNEELIRELIKDYHTLLPTNEKAYMAESELEEAIGNRQRSMEILVEAVTNMPNCPQVALRLADMQLDDGLFAEAKETAHHAMVASAEVQPSVNVPYLAYIHCLCDDALLHQRALAGEHVDTDEVKRVMAQYNQLEEAFPIIRMKHGSTISDRKRLLDFLNL